MLYLYYTNAVHMIPENYNLQKYIENSVWLMQTGIQAITYIKNIMCFDLPESLKHPILLLNGFNKVILVEEDSEIVRTKDEYYRKLEAYAAMMRGVVETNNVQPPDDLQDFNIVIDALSTFPIMKHIAQPVFVIVEDMSRLREWTMILQNDCHVLKTCKQVEETKFEPNNNIVCLYKALLTKELKQIGSECVINDSVIEQLRRNNALPYFVDPRTLIVDGVLSIFKYPTRALLIPLIKYFNHQRIIIHRSPAEILTKQQIQLLFEIYDKRSFDLIESTDILNKTNDFISRIINTNRTIDMVLTEHQNIECKLQPTEMNYISFLSTIEGTKPRRYDDIIDLEKYECGVCLEGKDIPIYKRIRTGCGHLICYDCCGIMKQSSSYTYIDCPICRTPNYESSYYFPRQTQSDEIKLLRSLRETIDSDKNIIIKGGIQPRIKEFHQYHICGFTKAECVKMIRKYLNTTFVIVNFSEEP